MENGLDRIRLERAGARPFGFMAREIKQQRPNTIRVDCIDWLGVQLAHVRGKPMQRQNQSLSLGGSMPPKIVSDRDSTRAGAVQPCKVNIT
jgi:hypothetical protein